MRTVLGEMGGEHHPQVLVTLGKTNGLTLRFCVFSWGLTMVDQKLIQNTNSQTLQVPTVCILRMVLYHMCLILLPVCCFGLFGGSRYLCLFVSKSHPGCEGCWVVRTWGALKSKGSFVSPLKLRSLLLGCGNSHEILTYRK